MTGAFDVNENSEVYYTGTYWNDFEVVRRRINGRISGEPNGSGASASPRTRRSGRSSGR